MDSIKGAQILAERLAAAGEPPASPPAQLRNPDALPLFHWVGVEPKTASVHSGPGST